MRVNCEPLRGFAKSLLRSWPAFQLQLSNSEGWGFAKSLRSSGISGLATPILEDRSAACDDETCRFRLAFGVYMRVSRVSRVASSECPGTGVRLDYQSVNIFIYPCDHL